MVASWEKKLLIWPLSSEILTRSHLTPPEILLNPYIRLLPGNSLSKNFQPISFLFKIICHVHQSPHSQSPHPQAPHPKSSRTPCLFNCWPLDRSLDDLVNGDLRALCLVGKIWRTLAAREEAQWAWLIRGKEGPRNWLLLSPAYWLFFIVVGVEFKIV